MKKIRQGNDTFFSVLVFNKKAILSEEATHEEDSAVDLSQVKNLKVQGVRLHPESFFFLPSKVEGNLIKVEFPSERQELGAYDVQIDYDTDNETSEDGLLHHRLRLALCRVIETNDYCNEDSADIDAPIKAYVLDAFKGVQGEKGERGEQGLQGERGDDGLSALELYNNENNTDYNRITDLFNKLIPKKEEGENINEFAKILFSSWGSPHNKWTQRREAKSLSLFADNEEVFKEILIKHYREVDPQVNDRLDSIGVGMISESIFKIKDNEVYFYPYRDFDYLVQGCNIFYEFCLGGESRVDKTYTAKSCNIVNNKFIIIICERVTRKVAVFEVEFSDTITNLSTLNSYVELKSNQYNFTNKNVDDFNSYLSDNTYIKRVIKEWTGEEVEGFRPYFYKYLKIDSVENKTFDEVNRRLFNNLVKGWD